MADVLHSALTGADLHESKGAATASLGQVAVATGAGAAVFTALSYAYLTGAPTIPAFNLNNGAVASAPLIKVYTATAAAGLWSVTPSGFTTIWGVWATALSGSQAIGTTASATVAAVSLSSITGANVVHSASANAISGTQTVQVVVIGV